MRYRIVEPNKLEQVKDFLSTESLTKCQTDPNTFCLCAIDEAGGNTFAGVLVYTCDEEISGVVEVNVVRDYSYAQLYGDMVAFLLELLKEGGNTGLTLTLYDEPEQGKLEEIFETAGGVAYQVSYLYQSKLGGLQENLKKLSRKKPVTPHKFLSFGECLSYEQAALSEMLWKQGYDLTTIPQLEQEISLICMNEEKKPCGCILVGRNEESGNLSVEYLFSDGKVAADSVLLLDYCFLRAMKKYSADTPVYAVAAGEGKKGTLQRIFGTEPEEAVNYYFDLEEE